jgi:hypothetical protein
MGDSAGAKAEREAAQDRITKILGTLRKQGRLAFGHLYYPVLIVEKDTLEPACKLMYEYRIEQRPTGQISILTVNKIVCVSRRGEAAIICRLFQQHEAAPDALER